MRTTLTIDDDIMRDLKEIAHREGLPMKQLVNRTLRLGLEAAEQRRPVRRHRGPTFSMGKPRSGAPDLDKALAFASLLEDEEYLRKLELRK